MHFTIQHEIPPPEQADEIDDPGTFEFGRLIAASEDGSTVAVATAVASADNSGFVYLYRRLKDPQNWQLAARFGMGIAWIPTPESVIENGYDSPWTQDDACGTPVNPDAAFGASLAINETGSVIVVGAPSSSIHPQTVKSGTEVTGTGTAYVFSLSDKTWKVAQLESGEKGDLFGYSVAAAQKSVVVGAPLSSADENGPPMIGAAYAFDQNDATDEWERSLLTATFESVNDVNDDLSLDRTGYQVCMSGATTLISSPNQGSLAAHIASHGVACAFEYRGPKQWQRAYRLESAAIYLHQGPYDDDWRLMQPPSPHLPGHHFGRAIACHGEKVFATGILPDKKTGIYSYGYNEPESFSNMKYKAFWGQAMATEQPAVPEGPNEQIVMNENHSLVQLQNGQVIGYVYQPSKKNWVSEVVTGVDFATSLALGASTLFVGDKDQQVVRCYQLNTCN